MSRLPADLATPLTPLSPLEARGLVGAQTPATPARRRSMCRSAQRFPVTEAHTPRARTGKSWTPDPAEGAEARVPCWWSRDQWIQEERAPPGAETTRRAHPAPHRRRPRTQPYNGKGPAVKTTGPRKSEPQSTTSRPRLACGCRP